MFLIKLIGKTLLLPVVLLLAILRLLVKIGMEVSSFILGALMLIVFGCIGDPDCDGSLSGPYHCRNRHNRRRITDGE